MLSINLYVTEIIILIPHLRRITLQELGFPIMPFPGDSHSPMPNKAGRRTGASYSPIAHGVAGSETAHLLPSLHRPGTPKGRGARNVLRVNFLR